MKKTTIWVFAMFLLFIPLAYSAPITIERFNEIVDKITLYATNDVNCTDDNSTYDMSGVASGTPTQEPNIGVQGACLYSGDDKVQWDNQQYYNMTNQTVIYWINYSTTNFGSPEVFLVRGTGTSLTDGGVRIMKDNTENIVLFAYMQKGGAQTSASASSPAFFGSADYVLLAISINITDKSGASPRADIYGFLNETVIATAVASSPSVENSDPMSFGARQANDQNIVNGHIGEIVWINMTLTTDDMLNMTKTFFNNEHLIKITQADTIPPSITYFNLTNGNGCDVWNTDKNIACNTSSVTPAVQFNTSENAWCAITGNSSVTLGKNYTDMGSSRNCTGAASGEGTREHFCTLKSEDEFVYETSYIYISCKDSSNNQQRNSTSGALKLSITGLESAGRTSIGIGIQNALLSSYTNYTDLQIYARNLSNSQVRGTFDRAAKKGSKMWAFNRIGVSDSYVNMFNLTPVLYALEFANLTSRNLTNQTQRLIEATK